MFVYNSKNKKWKEHKSNIIKRCFNDIKFRIFLATFRFRKLNNDNKKELR